MPTDTEFDPAAIDFSTLYADQDGVRAVNAQRHEMELLTFEPEEPSGWESEVREGLRADGIVWHHLRYHKRPSVPATMFDIANGARYIRKLARERSFDILHCRSHVPTMMAAIAQGTDDAKQRMQDFLDGRAGKVTDR